MRVSALRTIALIGIALSSLSLAGCAGRGGMKKGQDSNRYVARDVDTLYNAARDALDKKQYRMAAALFDEVERQHPYSVWARRSELMSSFAYYLAHSYPESIQSAQRFLSIHPGNRDAPYALYLIAVDYYEQISDVTRDQKITGQALDAMGELIRRYPDSKYAADARLKIDLINDHLAGKEMEIGRFYQRRGEWLASVIRFRTVIDKFQSSSHTPEALMRLTESYIALGVVDEAKKSAAVLGANYPGTDYYKHAYDLIQRRQRKG
ncbi:outer membrane protein assembly factor BamD [Sphingomonas sp. AP4-R1]|uniref:outer membrane protein assembly factor BamD n=1 Tax=Sphingomonas sp. AP4-R1 TaxID=2735134 RepID=UPI001493425D|nr:outer membrane protein assembly factor BamD [Sphingomonas sp. AP4-R1]QJU56528.1 outer membrane protein assembly factor BamD [Sphingomonas sp. AP4-R1]